MIRKLTSANQILMTMLLVALPFGAQASLSCDQAFLSSTDSVATQATTVSETVDQAVARIQAGIANGYLAPLDQFHISQLRYLAHSDEGSFERVGDPSSFSALKRDHEPLLAKHGRGLISVTDDVQAAFLGLYMRNEMNLKAQELRSADSAATKRRIKRDFNQGRFDYLITVEKLNEELSYPKVNLYIDFNRTSDSKLLLDKIAQVLRHREGKGNVDLAVMLDVVHPDLRDMIQILARIEAGAFTRDGRQISGPASLTPSHERLRTSITKLSVSLNGYVSYEQAREWVRKRGITSRRKWLEVINTGENRTAGVPRYPMIYYKNEWTNWDDFFAPAPAGEPVENGG